MNINTDQIFYIEETFYVSEDFGIDEKTAVYIPDGVSLDLFIEKFNQDVVVLQSQLDVQRKLAKAERLKASDCNRFMIALLDDLNLDNNIHSLLKEARDDFSLNARKIDNDASTSIPLRVDLLVKKHGGLFLHDIVDNRFNLIQNSLVPCNKN